MSEGHERHWILDDNIKAFFRLNHNLKVPTDSGTTFRVIEEFADRYVNLAMTGMNYFMFASRKTKVPPFTANTRIYSCILIQNRIPFRWRGRYNEDTDLSLRVLKSGRPTVLFNAFLCEKAQTMTMKGGNTDELYRGDGRLEMARSLWRQHPDVTKIVKKWGRWQHHVDYRPFKGNRLVRRLGVTIDESSDEFGMFLRKLPSED